jgi:peroxiredoxin family protein
MNNKRKMKKKKEKKVRLLWSMLEAASQSTRIYPCSMLIAVHRSQGHKNDSWGKPQKGGGDISQKAVL